MGCPGEPQAPDVGQAEHVPHSQGVYCNGRTLTGMSSKPLDQAHQPPLLERRWATRVSKSACFKAAYLHASLECQPSAPYGCPTEQFPLSQPSPSASCLGPQQCSPLPQLGLACFSALCRPPSPNSLVHSFHNHQTLLRSKGMAALPPQAPWPPTFCVTLDSYSAAGASVFLLLH